MPNPRSIPTQTTLKRPSMEPQRGLAQVSGLRVVALVLMLRPVFTGSEDLKSHPRYRRYTPAETVGFTWKPLILFSA